MQPVRTGLALVLFVFVVFSLWAAVAGGGLQGLVDVHAGSPWALQIFVDLVLALTIVSVFVWRDARARGANPWPWIAATLFLGSIAPLAYFVVRPGAEPGPARARTAPTA